MSRFERWFAVLIFCITFAGMYRLQAQLQQSGGAGTNVNATQTGTWTVQPGNTANTTAWKVDGSAVTQPVSGTFWQATQPVSGTVTANEGGTWTVQPGNTANTTAWKVDGSATTQPVSGTFWQATQPVSGTVTASNTAFALNAGTANIGFVRILPSACTQSTNFANSTAQVATGAGTTVTSTTTCVTSAYANNITNSAVTLRLADKQGTPVIWLGGNADFTIPANSNVKIPVDGVTFTSGITAIAGTVSAVNLQINGVQ